MPALTYHHVPTEIQALQWTGSNAAELRQWCPVFVANGASTHASIWVEANHVRIEIEPGSWILRDELGFHPCRDVVFRRSYAV
jgi:hypothetical protein